MFEGEEIKDVLNTKYADVFATKNIGSIMKVVMSELKVKADGRLIQEIVTEYYK